MEWLALLALAYLTRGATRVLCDFAAPPVDRPVYVEYGFLNRYTALAVVWWWNRQPIPAIVANMVWTFAILAGLYWILGLVIQMPAARLAILALIPICLFFAAAASCRQAPPSEARQPEPPELQL